MAGLPIRPSGKIPVCCLLWEWVPALIPCRLGCWPPSGFWWPLCWSWSLLSGLSCYFWYMLSKMEMVSYPTMSPNIAQNSGSHLSSLHPILFKPESLKPRLNFALPPVPEHVIRRISAISTLLTQVPLHPEQLCRSPLNSSATPHAPRPTHTCCSLGLGHVCLSGRCSCGRAPRGAGVASCGESSCRGREVQRAARQAGFAHVERGSLSSGCWGTFSSQQPC